MMFVCTQSRALLPTAGNKPPDLTEIQELRQPSNLVRNFWQ